MGGGARNRQDNLEREREKRRSGRGRVEGRTLGGRGTAASGVNSAARSSAREYVAVAPW